MPARLASPRVCGASPGPAGLLTRLLEGAPAPHGVTGAPPPRPGGSLGRYEGQAGVLNIQTRPPAYLPFQAEASYQEPEAAYRIQTLPLSTCTKCRVC